jgi:hypothetical protein
MHRNIDNAPEHIEHILRIPVFIVHREAGIKKLLGLFQSHGIGTFADISPATGNKPGIILVPAMLGSSLARIIDKRHETAPVTRYRNRP